MAWGGRPSHSLRTAFETAPPSSRLRHFLRSSDMALSVPHAALSPARQDRRDRLRPARARHRAADRCPSIVAEREGRLREAEASVAASLAVEPDGARPDPAARLHRELGGGPGRGQGQEGRDRAPLVEAGRRAGRPRHGRPGRARAAPPRHLQGQRLRDEGDRWPRAGRTARPGTAGRARRLAPRLRAAAAAAGARRFARRAQRHGPGRRQGEVAVRPGTGHPAHGRGFHVALDDA